MVHPFITDAQATQKIQESYNDIVNSIGTGFQGTIKIADTKTELGIYIPTEAGVYTNAGGLVYDPEGSDKGFLVQFIYDGTDWVKNRTEIDINASITNILGSDYISGFYVNRLGDQISNASYKISPFKPLISENIYISEAYEGNIASGNNGATAVALYDENFVFVDKIAGAIPGELNSNISFTKSSVPSNVKYFRTSAPISSNPIILGSETLYDKIKELEVGVDSSKEVAEAYANLIINLADLEIGAIRNSDGVNANNNIRIRFKDNLSIENGSYSITCSAGYHISRVFRYLDGVFVDLVRDNANFTIDTNIANEIRLVFAKTNEDEVITNEDLEAFTFNIIGLGFNKFERLYDKIKELDQETNWFSGKIYDAIGDSITYGFIPRNYTDYPGQLNSWAKQSAELLNMTFVNHGISGSTLGQVSETDTTSRSPMIHRISALNPNAKLVTFMGGTNDLRNISVLGTMDDRIGWTYYGALHLMCQGLLNKYIYSQDLTLGKDMLIVGVTPIQMFPNNTYGGFKIKDYVDAFKEVCAYYSIPCFDAWSRSGLTPNEFRTLQGTEPNYTDMYNPLITDGTHPTSEGNAIWAQRFVGFLKTLIAN